MDPRPGRATTLRKSLYIAHKSLKIWVFVQLEKFRYERRKHMGVVVNSPDHFSKTTTNRVIIFSKYYNKSCN